MTPLPFAESGKKQRRHRFPSTVSFNISPLPPSLPLFRSTPSQPFIARSFLFQLESRSDRNHSTGRGESLFFSLSRRRRCSKKVDATAAAEATAGHRTSSTFRRTTSSLVPFLAAPRKKSPNLEKCPRWKHASQLQDIDHIDAGQDGD